MCCKNYNKLPKIIAVSKTFSFDKILPLVEYGHIDYGENKVQEALDKWTEVKLNNTVIKIHTLLSPKKLLNIWPNI